MLHVTTLYASDVMEDVTVHLSIRRYEDGEARSSSIVYECTTTFPGTGETDPRQYAEDVLIGLLEAL